MTSRERALAAVSPQGRTGVEIGPLNRPLILPTDGAVLYADHLSADDLAAKYAGHDTVGVLRTEPIAPVDLVLDRAGLAETLGARGPVDYVVASHVMEHLPDPVGWLLDMAAALRDGGVLFLAVPDKRFTFDFRRAVSTTGDLVAHHLARSATPSPAQVFEHVARTVKLDLPAVWAGGGHEPPDLFGGQLPGALDHARAAAEHGHAFDVHCTVYTPCSFLDVFAELIALDLIPFEVTRIEPTEPLALEFFVTLRKRTDLGPAERAAGTPRLDRARHHGLPERAPPRRLTRRLALAWRVLRTGTTRAPART